ncbi:MAG TPA: holo-ACP synthase [Candidatus Omnitrophota bacterium]|nr:holo-ACP synthase [Candidatus Omnitrophota bacterium]
MGTPRIGVDLVKIKRMTDAIEKHGEGFLSRVFTEGEVAYCEAHPRRKFEHYAGRFAAKEAFYKAVQPREARIRFRNLEVKNLPNGAPEFFIEEEERKRLGLSPDSRITVSLSHDTDYAIAVVLIT